MSEKCVEPAGEWRHELDHQAGHNEEHWYRIKDRRGKFIAHVRGFDNANSICEEYNAALSSLRGENEVADKVTGKTLVKLGERIESLRADNRAMLERLEISRMAMNGLGAKIESLRWDKARLDWLEEQDSTISDSEGLPFNHFGGYGSLRTKIDAAMGETPEPSKAGDDQTTALR